MGSPVVRALTHCRGDRFPLIRAAHVAEQGFRLKQTQASKNVIVIIIIIMSV